VKTTLTESGAATAAAVKVKGGGEQVVGRERETATLFSMPACVCFAPRQRRRWAFLVKKPKRKFAYLKTKTFAFSAKLCQ